MKKIVTYTVLFYLRVFTKLAIFLGKPIIIGVAGSVGKSSTRNALYAIFKDNSKTFVAEGNSETGIPLGILGIETKGFGFFDWISYCLKAPFKIFNIRSYKYLIVEMGIDDPYPPKNMEYLLSILKPDIAVSLNIAGPHFEQFEKTLLGAPDAIKDDSKKRLDFILQKMAEEDTKIITKSNCRIGVYNSDDENIVNALSSLDKNSQTKLLSFGTSNRASIWYKSYSVTNSGTKFSYVISDTKKIVTLDFPNLLLPKAYREVFASSLLTAISSGINLPNAINSLLKNFYLPAGRSTILKGVRKTTIIDSSYNAPKKATLEFLALCEQLKKNTGKKLVFLMGDMRELGQESEIEHNEVANEIVKAVDFLYCVGTLTQKYIMPIVDKKVKSMWFENYKKAGEYLKDNIPQNSLVLVKGSQNTIFLEEAIKYLLKDKEDEKKLCRQDDYWLKIKKLNFSKSS